MLNKKWLLISILFIFLLTISICGYASYYKYTMESGANFYASTADKADALESENEKRQILDDLGYLLGHSKRDDSYPKDETTGGILSVFTNIVYCNDYDHPDDAITAINTNNKTLLVTEAETCDTNFTVPANVTVRFERGGKWTIDNGITVTFNGQINAQSHQIFELTGSGVITGFGNIEEAIPNWWGDTDIGSSINTALTAGCQNIFIPAGTYEYSTDIAISSKLKRKLMGAGEGTKLRYTGTGNAILISGNSKWNIIGDFYIYDAADNSNIYNFIGINETGGQLNKFSNITIVHCDEGISISGNAYFNSFDKIAIDDFGSYGLKIATNANYFSFNNIITGQSGSIGIEISGTGNEVYANNVSSLTDGTGVKFLAGSGNRVKVGYMETMDVAIENVSGNNYLGFGHYYSSIVQTGGVLIRENKHGVLSNIPEEESYPYNYGLVGAWLFTEGSETIVYNQAKNNHNMTLVNTPDWVKGWEGYGVNFANADDSSGTIPYHADFDLSSDFSFMIRFRDPIYESGIKQALIWESRATGGERILLGFYSTGLKFQVYDGESYIVDEVMSLRQRDAWCEITVCYDASETKWYIYKGGLLLETYTCAYVDAGGTFTINNKWGAWVRGDIIVDAHYWYNRLLTQQEVAFLCEKSKAGNPNPNFIRTENIVFPATQVSSADANTLDDYEENSWTPVLKFGGNSVGMTYGTQAGLYTKIGRQVTVTGYISLQAKGSSVGNATITGLPFTSKDDNGAYAFVGLRMTVITYEGSFQGRISKNSTSIDLNELTEAGVNTTLDNNNFSDSSSIILSATYFTD